jgi:hypothetical protein
MRVTVYKRNSGTRLARLPVLLQYENTPTYARSYIQQLKRYCKDYTRQLATLTQPLSSLPPHNRLVCIWPPAPCAPRCNAASDWILTMPTPFSPALPFYFRYRPPVALLPSSRLNVFIHRMSPSPLLLVRPLPCAILHSVGRLTAPSHKHSYIRRRPRTTNPQALCQARLTFGTRARSFSA